MSRKKLKPVRRKNEFNRALQAAKVALKAKTKQRDRAISELRELNIDIPNLERTCRALEAQLNPGSTGPDSRPTSQTVSKEVGGVLPGTKWDSLKFNSPEIKSREAELEIPPEIRAQLPPEDFSKFGSHFGDGPAADEEFLPEITGKPVVPEKA